jgi:hypothetical protein
MEGGKDSPRLKVDAHTPVQVRVIVGCSVCAASSVCFVYEPHIIHKYVYNMYVSMLHTHTHSLTTKTRQHLSVSVDARLPMGPMSPSSYGDIPGVQVRVFVVHSVCAYVLCVLCTYESHTYIRMYTCVYMCIQASGSAFHSGFNNDVLRSLVVMFRHADRGPKHKVKVKTNNSAIVSFMKNHVHQVDTHTHIYVYIFGV